MKAKRLLFGFITLVVSAFSLVAQEVISVNAEHLNSGQKKSLQYAKKILKTQGNKIMLPLEINALIGDTITLEPYVATPVWDDAYFVSDTTFEASLIIPLKTEIKNGNLLSTLKILSADKYTFLRMITTPISYVESDTLSYEIEIDSNLNGIMLMTSLYENNELKWQAKGVSDSYGVVDCTYESNYTFNFEIFRCFHTTYKNPKYYSSKQIFRGETSSLSSYYRDLIKKSNLNKKASMKYRYFPQAYRGI